jgi:hypothetical protein
MSVHKEMTQEEIRRVGLEALAQALGPIGMVRFLQQFVTGQGDFTEERQYWLGQTTVAELAGQIRAEGSKQQNGDREGAEDG